MNSVIKIKNLEGYYFRCAKCGREIKHAYKMMNENPIYGSECILTIAGIDKKQVKELLNREKMIKKILTYKSVYFFDEYCKAHNFTENQLVDYFLETGKLN